jgi:hypothetical protein
VTQSATPASGFERRPLVGAAGIDDYIHRRCAAAFAFELDI